LRALPAHVQPGWLPAARGGLTVGPLGRLRYRVGRRRAASRFSHLLRQTAERATTPDELFDAASSLELEELSIVPIQVRTEIVALLALLRAEHPRRVLEIGTANGGTLYLLAWASAADAQILSLDIRHFDPLQRRIFESFGRGAQRVRIEQGDSHLESTRDAVRESFGGNRLDFLFIDGDHSASSVRRDYELYAPLVRPGGLIAFHDIVDGPDELVGGVPAFWREVRAQLDDPRELVESWEQGGFGIGVGRVRPPAS
jgi:predicted O-methyltransferase YrrM